MGSSRQQLGSVGNLPFSLLFLQSPLEHPDRPRSRRHVIARVPAHAVALPRPVQMQGDFNRAPAHCGQLSPYQETRYQVLFTLFVSCFPQIRSGRLPRPHSADPDELPLTVWLHVELLLSYLTLGEEQDPLLRPRARRHPVAVL